MPFFFLVILFFDDFIGLAVFLCDFFSVPLRFRGFFIGFFRADFLATGFCAAFFLVVRPAFLLPFFVVIFLVAIFTHQQKNQEAGIIQIERRRGSAGHYKTVDILYCVSQV